MRGRMVGMRIWSDTGRWVLGGGMCGFMLAKILVGLTGSNTGFLLGIMFGIPAEMIIGAMLAAVWSRRRAE
jgi:hypothetical protein